MKSRVLSKIEKFGMGEDGEDAPSRKVKDNDSDTESKRKSKPREVDLNKVRRHIPTYS
jgi:hypothetical protein